MKILHLVIREFYLTIEREKRGMPKESKLVIHFPENPGFVVTQSSEALAVGIRSQMPLEKAKSLLPDGVFIPADFQAYAQTSEDLTTRLREICPFIEQIDFYEWFCDLSGHDEDDFEAILRKRLCAKYPFRMDFGVSRNKFLAKLGNDTGKTFEGRRVRELLMDTPVEHFWGIPKKWIAELKKMGIKTIGEVGGLDPGLLEKKIPKHSRRIVQLGRGDDDHGVQPFSKPMRLSRNGMIRLTDTEAAKRKLLARLAEELSDQLVKSGHAGFALHMEITGGGQRVTNRYRFLLPTVRPSSILVGATTMFKKMREYLPSDGTIALNLAVGDIVYDRDVYQMHGAPHSDLEVMPN